MVSVLGRKSPSRAAVLDGFEAYADHIESLTMIAVGKGFNSPEMAVSELVI